MSKMLNRRKTSIASKFQPDAMQHISLSFDSILIHTNFDFCSALIYMYGHLIQYLYTLTSTSVLP